MPVILAVSNPVFEATLHRTQSMHVILTVSKPVSKATRHKSMHVILTV